jgi:thiamine pyrophosphate-dependent acetolactate synthase large subunit-like protein
MTLTKTAAIARVLAALAATPAVFTTGYTSRIARSLDDRPQNFYMTGSMGLALPVGIGIAMASGRTTVVVDGDGSILMNPVGLVSAGSAPDLPVIHLVLDDGEYASTGGQPSPSTSVDLVAWAVGAGFRLTHTVRDADTLSAVLADALRTCACPTFVRCFIVPDIAPPPPRIPDSLGDHAQRFMSCFAG